jgi:RNA polymerase sigma-70 factor (ECF subfamily)
MRGLRGLEMKSKFEKLYDTYYDSVYRYIYVCVKDKWNAEDIISTVFFKIYENRDKIQEVESSKNWVFRIAHNAIIDFYRKNGKVILLDDFMETASDEEGYDVILTKDEFGRIKKYIDELPEETVNMIYMRYYGGLKFKDIAAALEKSENTVKSVITRGLKKIRTSYEESLGGNVYEKQ